MGSTFLLVLVFSLFVHYVWHNSTLQKRIILVLKLPLGIGILLMLFGFFFLLLFIGGVELKFSVSKNFLVKNQNVFFF
jgi:hypothetical protein